MKTITIYELLGMIKDGKAPKKIKYDGQEYIITKILLEDNNYYFNYINEDMECIFPINTNTLNDTVEILEEPKGIPEKIKIDNEDRIQALSTGNFVYKVNQPTKNIIYKINEICDYLKNKGE